MQPVLDLDTRLLFFLNIKLANSFFDLIMPFVTDLDNWVIPLGIAVIILLVKGGKRGRAAVLLMIPVLIITDQTAATLIKPWIGRIRPCHVLEAVRTFGRCGGKYGFPSNHAANMAGFAMLFTLFYPRFFGWFWAFALLIGYSRVYVGVHYPGDILGGFILGILAALLVYFIYRPLAARYPAVNGLPPNRLI
ncbi:MAG: phosphatase PAP2 family protein [Calditrichia bacterium]